MSEEKKPTYNLHVKKSLTLKQGAPIPDQVGMRGIFKDHKNFPKGTKYKWLLPPDTSQNKYTNAKIQVIFPDGTKRQHTVHYQIYVPGIKINQPRKKKKAKPVAQPQKTTPKAAHASMPKKTAPVGSLQKPKPVKQEVAQPAETVETKNKQRKWIIVAVIVVAILLILAIFMH